jgi:hypothetical protein
VGAAGAEELKADILEPRGCAGGARGRRQPQVPLNRTFPHQIEVHSRLTELLPHANRPRCRVYLVQLNIYNVSLLFLEKLYELMPLTSRLGNTLMKENTNPSFEYCTINFELPMSFFLIRTRSKKDVITPTLDVFSQLEKKLAANLGMVR